MLGDDQHIALNKISVCFYASHFCVLFVYLDHCLHCWFNGYLLRAAGSEGYDALEVTDKEVSNSWEGLVAQARQKKETLPDEARARYIFACVFVCVFADDSLFVLVPFVNVAIFIFCSKSKISGSFHFIFYILTTSLSCFVFSSGRR